MMILYSKKDKDEVKRLSGIIEPWIYYNEEDRARIREDAPEEVKEAYKKRKEIYAKYPHPKGFM